MPRGDKDKYTEKQKRKAEHIEESYEHKGVSKMKQSPALGPLSINSPVAERKRAVRASTRRRTRRKPRAPIRPGAQLKPERATHAPRDLRCKARPRKA